MRASDVFMILKITFLFFENAKMKQKHSTSLIFFVYRISLYAYICEIWHFASDIARGYDLHPSPDQISTAPLICRQISKEYPICGFSVHHHVDTLIHV